jgi:hypothetical protein
MPPTRRRPKIKAQPPVPHKRRQTHHQRRLEEIATELNLESTQDVIPYLIDFYDMKYLDDLGQQLRRLEIKGPTLVQMAQLSILYTILGKIAESLPVIGYGWRQVDF